VPAINNRGEVAGGYSSPSPDTHGSHGFFHDDGTFTTIDPPGATIATVTASNNRGEVAGPVIAFPTVPSPFVGSGFVYENGVFTGINPPGADATTGIVAINDRGEVVGTYRTVPSFHPFVYHDGTFTTIEVPGATTTTVAAINNRGEVAGSYATSDLHGHGFVDDHGAFTIIDAPGATSTGVTAINDRRDIAGQADLHAFLATAAHGHGATSMDDYPARQAWTVDRHNRLMRQVSRIRTRRPQYPSARCRSREGLRRRNRS
jgi:hypothetical protein